MSTRNSAAVWLSIGLSYAAMMSLAVAVNLMPVFLTTLRADLGGAVQLSNEQLGRIGAITFVGLVAGILITGPLADRFGAKPFAIGGNLLIAAGLLLIWRAPGYGTLLAAVALMGGGAGVLDMVLSPIVSALQPHRRSAAMNWLHSFYCIGAVATVLVASSALRFGVHWRVIALGMIAIPLLVAAGFTRMTLPALVAHEDGRLPLRQLMRIPLFLVAVAAIFLAGATELGLAQWLPAYAEVDLGFTPWVAGMSLLFFSVAMALGRILAGLIGHRVAGVVLMRACCWVTAILFVVACFAPWPGLRLAAAIATGLTGSCLWPTMLGVTADRFPRGGASMFGMLAAFGNFGGVFMPWIVGATADMTGRMNWGISLAVLCPLGMIALLRAMDRRHAAMP